MKISERALNFAIKAHEGEFRKDEPDRPYILHPMIVGDILKYHNFDDNVVAAGYLHDVVENTGYSIEDISRLFGGDIASLVMTATYPTGFESWHDKRKYKIKLSKDLPVRNKAIILADQIANIEEHRIVSDKKGYIDFSNYQAGYDDQKWYIESMFDSLNFNIDESLTPLLNRFYLNIQHFFYKKDIYENEHRFNLSSAETKKILAQKEELGSLKRLLQSSKPFVIEFSNDKNTFNRNLIDICLDFFQNDGYKIKVIENKNYENKYEKEYIKDKQGLNKREINLLITYEIASNLLSELSNDQDIIILDEGIFFRLIWMRRLLENNSISKEEYVKYVNFYLFQINNFINYTVFSYTSTKNLQIKNNFEYITAMECCQKLLDGKNLFLNSNDDSELEASYRVLENLLPIMRSDYIKQLKLMIQKKGQE
ncbi:MAG: HD domain-containing protein [Bacilli bacterium]|nr:HD domain-containing protein [Bacilli bacterium]